MPWLLYRFLKSILIFQFHEICCNKRLHFTCAWWLMSSSCIWEELPCLFPAWSTVKYKLWQQKQMVSWAFIHIITRDITAHDTRACCSLCEPTHPPVILPWHVTMSLPAEVGDLEEQLVNHTGYTLPYRDCFCLRDASGVCHGRRVTRRKVTRLPRAAPWLLACRDSLMGAVVVGC